MWPPPAGTSCARGQDVPDTHTALVEDEDFIGAEEIDIVYVKDKGGNSVKLQLIDGLYYYPLCEPSTIRSIRSLTLRNDDIYLNTYLRTGTHWTFEILSMLMNGKAETIKKYKGRHQLEYETGSELDCLPSPRVLNTHMKLSLAPDQLREKKCKIIFTLRDPRDAAVSHYHLYIDTKAREYEGRFEDFLYLYLEGKVDCNGIFEHWRDAEKFLHDNPDIPVHFQVYEEALQDPVLSVQKLSDFLGLKRNDALCRAIAEKCEFSRMKVDKDPYCFKVDGENKLYRRGVVGDWQNYFTDQMLEDYFRVYDEKMAGSMFYNRYARQKTAR